MHQSSHLHPEWGLLVVPRSVARTARILMIAAAVGVTAGAGVISSLAERSSEQPAIVAQTLVQPVQQPAAKPANAQAKAPRIAETKTATAPVARSQPVAALAGAQNQKKANKKHPGPRYAARGRQFTSMMDDWYHAVGL